MLDSESLGPYRIGKRIGVGGMGAVYEGRHVESDQLAAIKVLIPALAASEGFRDRFEAEIKSLQQLNHANIVHFFGYGEQDGHLFYAMELVEGRSLESELASGRRFDWREVTSIGIQVAKALKHAHDHGIIHRDLKPANLLLTEEGNVKLLDFGIARLFGNTNLTASGGVVGTADYMSPEQAEGRPVNDRCDQYALGCVLYALLTGKPPFKAETLPELLQLQRFAEPEPVRRYVSDVPADLERVIAQLLSKHPEQRFPNCQVVSRRMEAMFKALSRPVAESDFDVQPAPRVEPSRSTEAELGVTRHYEPDAPHPAFDATRVAPSSAAEVADDELELEAPTSDEAKTAHFTSMAEIRRRERMRERRSWPLIIAQSASVLAMLAAALALAWWMFRPPSADALYERIQEYAAEGRMDRLVFVESEIDEFLLRFPDDPRAAEIKELNEDVELARTAQKLRNRARRASTRGGLIPIERMYVSAIRHSDDEPERAMAELAALVNLYQDDLELSQREERCLTLAQRQFNRLRDRVYQYADGQLDEFERRFATAKDIQPTDPERAIRMWRAIVRLGGDKPWAAEVVQKAQAELQAAERKTETAGIAERGKK